MKRKIKNLFDLENKVIVITGGSGYLGSEFSFAFSDVGAIPVILDRNEKSLKILEKKLQELLLLVKYIKPLFPMET